MRPHRLPVALVAFIAIVVVLPIWLAVDLSVLSSTNAFIAALILPAMVLLFASSWIKPEMAWPITGVFVLVGIMALGPTFDEFTRLAAEAAGVSGLAAVAIQLAVPLIILAFIATMAGRRLGVGR